MSAGLICRWTISLDDDDYDDILVGKCPAYMAMITDYPNSYLELISFRAAIIRYTLEFSSVKNY